VNDDDDDDDDDKEDEDSWLLLLLARYLVLGDSARTQVAEEAQSCVFLSALPLPLPLPAMQGSTGHRNRCRQRFPSAECADAGQQGSVDGEEGQDVLAADEKESSHGFLLLLLSLSLSLSPLPSSRGHSHS